MFAEGSTATWGDVLDTVTAHKIRPLEEKVKALEVENERLKAGARSAERPNLGQGTGSGGKSDRELLADPTTPIETIMEIRARQKAG